MRYTQTRDYVEMMAREEMRKRKTRYYVRNMIWNGVVGIIGGVLVVGTILATMAVFVD